VTDVRLLATACWNDYYSLESRLSDKAASLGEKHKLLETSMRSLVTTIYVHVLSDSEKFNIDWVHPMRSSPLTALGFLHKEHEFALAVLSEVATEGGSEDLQKKADLALAKAKTNYQDALAKGGLRPAPPRPTLPGEGDDFVASGMPCFSMLDAMGGGLGEDDGPGAAAQGADSAFENFLNKQRGTVRAVEGTIFRKGAAR
jgi:hypothetical protein